MAEQKENVVRVCVTGAAGQIGYSLLPLLATGQVFGANQKVVLQLLEITPVLPALEGVRMELDDCAYPLVDDIICTDKAEVAFKDVDFAILVGGFPRKAGMQRKDLLAKNAPIFIAMGQALDKYAKKTVKVVVVANPANTNCLIAATNAPSIPKENFCALTRLDQNRAKSQIAAKLQVKSNDVKNIVIWGCVDPTGSERAKSQIAAKLQVKSNDVKNIVIWGNHSATQVPDVNNATVNGKAVELDAKYLKDEFVPCVQKRGAAIIKARGFSSALSAANGAKDCMRDWVQGTPQGETVAMAVYSDGSYGIEKGIFYSFPCTTKDGAFTIVTDYKVTDDIKTLMKASEKELLEEKSEALPK
eukprot:CAMPEP_0202726500 /NCGR_PEP_ID=MMETSP1385-20130828/184643_1 /ASSEMBLY_ACC=CAM_ASM_000861 /TAXON_ID=933848 /ORGANISM="Elphidium margaritaceum" /LENGTH=358 /DNA_ID=CAMNT_0049392721 /DNA_START=98 /DNA_END=1175 /DNA_ORIENTATION=-